MNRDRGYWLISFETTNIGLQRFGRALIQTCSTASGSTLGFPRMGRGVSADLVVGIMPGKEAEFRELCQPQDMGPNPKLILS